MLANLFIVDDGQEVVVGRGGRGRNNTTRDVRRSRASGMKKEAEGRREGGIVRTRMEARGRAERIEIKWKRSEELDVERIVFRVPDKSET